MRKYFIFLLSAVVLIVTFFFSSTVFLSAYSADFVFNIQTVDATLGQLESQNASFTVSFNPSSMPDIDEENSYAIYSNSHCNQRDNDWNCLDSVPNLCPYLSLIPSDEEDDIEIGFTQNPFGRKAKGKLNNPSDANDNWNITIQSPCFEGECPSDYDESQNGAPLLQSQKGQTFKCDLSVELYNTPVLMKNDSIKNIAYADDSSNLIKVSAVFTGELSGCTVDCFSNIIFVPGFEGSRLYEKSDDESLIQRWEAGIASFTDVDSLSLDNLGNSINNIFVGDVTERTNYTPDLINTNFYSSISNWLRETKASSIINDFFMFPYDWRLDVSDLAKNGSISTNDETLNLKDKIIELSQSSKTNKVTLIGHSNGGLLIKKTIQLLKDSGQENLVDKVITLGSPQLGTPKAIAAMLHGDGASLGGGFVLTSEKARSWGENLAGAYGLIPSEKYYQKAGPIVSFDESLNNNWISLYGEVLDYEEQNDFLTGQDGREKPAFDNLEFPTILNESLLNKANELHDNIDNLEFPEGMEFYEIAGVGVPTLEKLTYKSRLLGTVPVDYKLNFSCDGDKTVVSQSAIDSDLNPYYINLFDYQKDIGDKFSHSNLVENPEILNLISNITINTNEDISHITTTKPSLSGCKFKIFGIFSPADLDVYDREGRHTGINKDISNDNFIAFDTEIPDSDFFMIGDQKYVVVPDEGEYNIKIDGTGTGVFTLDITTQENDQVVNNTSYNNIPVNPKLEAEIVVDSNDSEEALLKIDTDGDGKIDKQIPPNNEEKPLSYLEKIKRMIIELNLPKKIEKQLLQRIDKIIKSISKNKQYLFGENINKFMKKIELDHKFIKKFKQKDRDNFVKQIDTLLNNF